METAYDGRQVVGMDLHRRRSVLVRMTEDGRRLGTARITNSPAELRKALTSNPEQFAQTLTEKLLMYALGRTVNYRDMPLVRKIVAFAVETPQSS